MSVKDKVVFGVLLLLIIGAGYFQWLASDLKVRMAELNTADIEHVDIIDKEFRESLRKYNIKFEGRGKHIKKAQDDIIKIVRKLDTQGKINLMEKLKNV